MPRSASPVSKYKPLANLMAVIGLSLALLANPSSPVTLQIRSLILNVSAYLYVPIQWVDTLFSIQRTYRDLEKKYIQAQIDLNQMRTLAQENQRLRNMLGFKGEKRFQVIPANVLSNVGNQTMSSLTVDQGLDDGVQLLAGVVDAQAQLVGKIVAISPKTSLVQLVNDKNFRVSVREMRSRNVGILSFTPRKGYVIRDVPRNAEVIAGDSVVTSGFSDIFPEHIFVGWVSDISPVIEDYVKSVQVDLASDFNRLEEVFILNQDD